MSTDRASSLNESYFSAVSDNHSLSVASTSPTLHQSDNLSDNSSYHSLSIASQSPTSQHSDMPPSDENTHTGYLGQTKMLNVSSPTDAVANSVGHSPQFHPTPSRSPRSKGRNNNHISTPHSSSKQNGKGISSNGTSDKKEERGSVKHLTCFWWKEKGHCKYSEAKCLYAHQDTGLYTDAPRQVIPGEPAKAGKSLDRAIKNLTITNNRSGVGILNRNDISPPPTPTHDTNTTTATTLSTPSSINAENSSTNSLEADNAMLKILVQQSAREKAVLLDFIDAIKSEKENLEKSVNDLEFDRNNLVHRYEILSAWVNHCQVHHNNRNNGVSNALNSFDLSPRGATGIYENGNNMVRRNISSMAQYNGMNRYNDDGMAHQNDNGGVSLSTSFDSVENEGDDMEVQEDGIRDVIRALGPTF